MKLAKHNTYIRTSTTGLLSKRYYLFHPLVFFLFGIAFTACSDFVEVDPPKNILISETVFDDPATVESALANIYYEMREQGMVSGNFGFTTALGIYSDELDFYGFDANYSQLYHHTVIASNTTIFAWWSNAYNLIYSANDILKGVDESDALTVEEKNKFRGQALFVRGYMHSLLVTIFGDIPFSRTTDYLENNTVSRLPEAEVYDSIIADLMEALDLLDATDLNSGERVWPGKDVAKALLARMYVYTEQWELAQSMASEIIDTYSLEADVNDVFLKDSSETIWQLKPGDSPRNTHEANQLVIQFIPGQTFALTDTLLAAFEEGDLRYTHWVGNFTNTDTSLYFAYKYKALFSETESVEYPILFRLAEQYLIRAEARLYLADLLGAREDINAIRNRAGLPNTTATTSIDLLNAILQERRVELFAEQGHRWFDLKRTGRAGDVLMPIKPNWHQTDLLLPIPDTELELNPNLLPQNNGY